MNTISRDDLRQLATMDGEYVVSIYMPANVGADSRQNPVRFNNLVRAAGQKMLDRKIGEPAVQKMTVSARTLGTTSTKTRPSRSRMPNTGTLPAAPRPRFPFRFPPK